MVFPTVVLAGSQAWTLVCGGDLMLNQIPYRANQNPLAALGPIFKAADFAIANLESPLTTAKKATSRKTAAELKARTQYLLKGDPRFAAMIADAGIRCVGQANNHCMDYGAAGIQQEARALDKAKVLHAGAGLDAADSARPAVFALPDGKKVGVLCALAFVGAGALRKCTPATLHRPGIFVLSFAGKIDDKAKAKLAALVRRAKESCDFLILGFHWGVERKALPIPYQVALGRAAIDAGADMVWGHHPHVLEGAELYKGHPILYSMGNLVSPTPAETALVRLTFDGNRLTSMQAVPCRVSGGRVKPNPKVRASLQDLSLALRAKYKNKDSRLWFTPKPAKRQVHRSTRPGRATFRKASR